MTQGAVSSSSRIDRLKLDTAKEFKNSWQNSEAYKDKGAGITSKQFDASCVTNLANRPLFDGIRVRMGNPTRCVITPIANLYQQSPSTKIVYSR